MDKIYKYLVESEKPKIKEGVFEKSKNVESWDNDNCMRLKDNQVGVSALVELKHGNTLIVQMYAESFIDREDGGEVEKKMIVATLRSLKEGLNMYCENWMKEHHNYTFHDHLGVPTLEEVERRVNEHLSHQN